MTTQKYLCPPRLQKKFLLWWWTVPELILIATLVVATFYLTSLELMALTLFVAIGAARVDFEHNLFGALRTRTLYQLFTKTFTANEKRTAKEEKRQRKRLTKQMRSRLPIQDLIQFRFADNGIYGGKDGKELFRFYRYYPPNTDVMTDEEIAQEIEQLCRLFDSLRCPFTMFGTDKIEDMSALKEYYRSLPRRYDHILADVVNEIESTETKSSAVQRAYYFIYKAQSEEDDIYTLIVGKGYKIDRVKNDEMAVLLRNYLVREFINVDIYTIAEEVKNYPNMAKAKPAIYNKEIQRRLCPNRIDFTRDHAEQSGLMRRTLMIKNFPAQIPPRALYTVASMRGTSFTMRMTPLQKDNARKLIDEQIRNKAVIGGKSQATEQMDAAQETMDIKNFYAEVTRNQNTIYSVNVYIEIYGKTLEDLANLEQQVKIELAGVGITYDQLNYEQRNGFSSVQPLGSDHFILCSNNLPSKTVAALYPFSYSSLIHPHGMPLGRTDRGGPVYADIFQRDDQITNGVFFISGSAGQGKSYLQKKILTFMVTRGVHCYVMDPENEYSDVSDDSADCDNSHTESYCPGDHYDLYVTARLPGCENWNGESGATEQTVAQWEELCSPSYTGESEVMEQYLQELQAATLNDDWEGWSEVNIEWTKVLYQTDWEDLYGVTVTQVGITNTDSFTPSEDYTGGITGSGNGTFIIPLASYSYISCHFGEPDGWTGAPHGGMDFAAGYGTPIYAAADGVVVKAGYHNSWGNYVKIYHGVVDGNQIYTLYAHCSSLGVSAGQTVTQGQTIAAVGSTGDSTGNHLHFEVYVNNTRVAPENWL